MKRNPFLIFFLIVAFLVSGALWFIQSRTFAGIVKGVIARYLPKDMGIDADFSEFAIQMFPPALSLKNPRIVLRKNNILKMAAGSSVEAKRIDFDFRPLQMITGNVRVHQLIIIGGKLHLFADQQPRPRSGRKTLFNKSLGFNFHWDELFQIHAEAIVIQDSQARIEWSGSKQTAELAIRSLKLGQWIGRGGLGYVFKADLSHLGGTVTRKLPMLTSMDSLQASAHFNAIGVQIDSVHLKGKGVEVHGSGMIRGNLQAPRSGLHLNAELAANGDVGTFAKSIPQLKLGDLTGSASFSGRVRGDLVKPLETLRVEGKLSGESLHFRNFVADELSASGAWIASPQGGKIELRKASVMAKERPRAPGRTATGGKIEVGPLNMKLGTSDPVSLHLDLDHARLQWLASLGLSNLKPVYPVQMKLTGGIDARVIPPFGKQKFRLQSRLKLKVDDFLLDNQKLTENRHEQKIFEIPHFTLEGPLTVDTTGLRVDGIALALQRTKLTLAGGVDFKNGFDLRGSGPASLAELGEVAGNPIRGDGPIAVRVHGPRDKLLIDVDVDARNASYLHLDLGDIKGRITWDDDPNHLLLHQMQAVKGETEYSVDGMLDLGKANSISLTAAIPHGNMRDFLQVFDGLTKDLWWFPSSLSGPFSGGIKIFGGVKMSELQISGTLNGTNWDYQGERFSKVALQGGYDRGKYYLSDVKATKRKGRILGRISYDDSGMFDWDFHTENMEVSDLDHIAQLDVPIRGRIQIDSSGKGKSGSVRSDSKLTLSHLLVRGISMPSSEVTWGSMEGVHHLHGSLLGNEGKVDINYNFDPTEPSTIHANFSHFDFSPALLLLNPKAISDPLLSGYFSGSMDLNFRSGQLERADGEARLTEYVLSKTGSRFALLNPISLLISDGSFNIKNASLASFGTGNSPRSVAVLNLKSRKGELDGKVGGNMDVSIAEFFTGTVQQASGVADLDFDLKGTIKSPMVSGGARLDGDTLWVRGLESPIENLTGELQLRQNAIYIQDVEADLAGGRAKAGGTILLFSDRYPLVSIKFDLSGNKLRFYPFEYAKVKGALSVTGDRIPYLVEGDLTVESALSKVKVLQQNSSRGLKATLYTPPPSSQRISDYPKFKLKINVSADRGILVQNDLFDAELKAKVTVVNTIDAPRLLGSVDLVQGVMVFKDRKFQLQSANATFDNPTVIDPKFNLTAKTDINGIKVQLYAVGTLDNRKIELSSTPVMSETDILSLLAIGITPSESKRLSASDRTTIESGEAASLLLHSLDFNREVQNKTGLQIQLNETTNTQLGTSLFRAPVPGDNAAAPKIVIKKQLTKNLDVSYGSTVGVGTGSQRQFNAEVKVTPGLSVIGVWDNYNYESLEGATQDKTNSSYSYGLDFKLEKRFK